MSVVLYDKTHLKYVVLMNLKNCAFVGKLCKKLAYDYFEIKNTFANIIEFFK